MELNIRPAAKADFAALVQLYRAVTDALEGQENQCGWQTGAYPTEETIKQALQDGCIYIAEFDREVAGAVHLSQRQEDAYRGAPWRVNAPDKQVITIHMLAVHPAHRHQGVARAMLANADIVAAQWGCDTLRLDVYETNRTAQALYEAHGFQYISTVDLGYDEKYHNGLKWFKLYERTVPAMAKALFRK